MKAVVSGCVLAFLRHWSNLCYFFEAIDEGGPKNEEAWLRPNCAPMFRNNVLESTGPPITAGPSIRR